MNTRRRAPVVNAQEFSTQVRLFDQRLRVARRGPRKVQLLREAIRFHIQNRRSPLTFITNHQRVIVRRLFNDELRAVIEAERAKLYDGVEDFLTRYLEVEADAEEFAELMLLVNRFKSHNNSFHIPLKDCPGCLGEIIEVALLNHVAAIVT